MVKSILAAIFSLALLAPLAALGDYATQQVRFPALNDFEGRPITLTGWLYRPSGKGPFPAVVMLHGCGGQYDRYGNLTPSYHRWAELLGKEGYVALLADSFGPRGQRSICEQQTRTILVGRERVEDAYAALRWLARRPDVVAARVGLIGWSNGGSGTLFSLLPANRREAEFRAAVAFYPGCLSLSRARTPYRPYAPLLLLAGEEDDWTPAAPCVELTASAKRAGAIMDIVTYPGAHHSFDRVNLPVRYRPNVRNPNQPDGRGATVGEHPEAREDAVRRTLEFFAKSLKD